MMRDPAAWFAVATLALGIVASPPDVNAQTIVGRVLDQDSEQPVGGAIVSLLEEDGDERRRTLTDSAGRFTIEPPEAGPFYVRAQGFGYFETRSPLIALTTGGQAALELMMVPEPIGLEGLEVSVEEQATRELAQMGLSRRELGNRWIDRDEIDAIPVKRDMGVVIERAGQASLRVLRPENLAPGSDDMGLCISQQRARTGAGAGRCSLVVLDGVPISGVAALDIDPSSIESIAILDPIQASTFYGTLGGSGAVLVWTRRGR